MSGYDFERPFMDSSAIQSYRAIDREIATRYGPIVRAVHMSNSEYAIRYGRLATPNNMKPPPSHGRIFDGYLVVRKLGTREQYETWIPSTGFEDVYVKAEIA